MKIWTRCGVCNGRGAIYTTHVYPPIVNCTNAQTCTQCNGMGGWFYDNSIQSKTDNKTELVKPVGKQLPYLKTTLTFNHFQNGNT